MPSADCEIATIMIRSLRIAQRDARRRLAAAARAKTHSSFRDVMSDPLEAHTGGAILEIRDSRCTSTSQR